MHLPQLDRAQRSEQQDPSPLPTSLECFANHPWQVDWDKATREYGAASVDSYKKGMQNTTKKIKKAMESGVEPEAADATPAKKGGGGKKRKEKTAEAEADGEAEESPTKKKKGGRKTKAQKEAEAAAAAEEAEDGSTLR